MFKSLIFLILSFNLYASTHQGVIVRKQGDVELLTNPSKTVSKNGKTVLYEGIYYTLQKARLGMKVRNGNIIRTKNKSKARVVYRNGDQVNVGEGSTLKIYWERKKKSKKTVSGYNLIYGKVRAIINKDGPRSGSIVKTKSAVMGIRGTDFSVTQRGANSKTSLAVIRGKVNFNDSKRPKKIIQVKQGFSAEVENNKKKATKLSISKTTKKELEDIQRQSEVKKSKDVKSTKLEKELAKLEEKATENTLKDIKTYEPELYKKLKKNKINDIDKINKVVVGTLYVKAPKKKKKLSIDDINLDENAYEKYFEEE